MPRAATIAAPAPSFQRAKVSDDYVSEMAEAAARFKEKTGRTEPNASERTARLQAIMADKSNYMRRVGQAMVGPIMLKLRYQGITRNVLLEQALEPGAPIEFDVLDDLGQAYVLHGSEGEVKVTRFEGKRVPARLFRIAAYPQVKKEDLWLMRVNIVDYAQDEAKQAIMKQEDARLITALESAITDYGTLVPEGAAVINELSGSVTPDSFYDLVAIIEARELTAARVLMNPADFRDLYKWEINDTGFAWKDRIFSGDTIEGFGEFQVQRSVMVPRGTIYLTPEPQYMGIFPTMYSLQVEENNTPAKFHRGWVMDELVGMAILNARGIAKIVIS